MKEQNVIDKTEYIILDIIHNAGRFEFSSEDTSELWNIVNDLNDKGYLTSVEYFDEDRISTFHITKKGIDMIKRGYK